MTEIFQQPALIAHHAILATLFVAMLVISLAVALAVLICLPPDYIRAPRAQGFQNASRGIFFHMGMVLKNLLGAMLIVLGVVLVIPGIPGQGLLTVLAGVILLDFPGKRRLLCAMLSRPLVLRSINRMRTRFSRPPLVIG